MENTDSREVRKPTRQRRSPRRPHRGCNSRGPNCFHRYRVVLLLVPSLTVSFSIPYDF